MKGKRPILWAGLALALLTLAACSDGQKETVNEMTFSLEGITQVTLSYDEELITFRPGTGDQLVVREYMTENKPAYRAKVTEKGTTLQLQEGGKPLFHGTFARRVEVLLPEDYGEGLTVTTTEGAIDLTEVALRVDRLRLESTAGTVQVGQAEVEEGTLATTSGVLAAEDLTGEKLTLTTTSGQIRCDRLTGTVDCRATSGAIQVDQARGGGSYRMENGGTLAVTYREVTGDLTLYNKNDSLQLTLPAELAFSFQASTKNGTITTDFPVNLSDEGRMAKAVVGGSPKIIIRAETKNGGISVSRG